METLAIGWVILGTLLTMLLGAVLLIIFLPLLVLLIGIVLLFSGAPFLGVALVALSLWRMAR